nr:hypothetical protein [Tanacetum cinerariifolium]
MSAKGVKISGEQSAIYRNSNKQQNASKTSGNENVNVDGTVDCTNESEGVCNNLGKVNGVMLGEPMSYENDVMNIDKEEDIKEREKEVIVEDGCNNGSKDENDGQTCIKEKVDEEMISLQQNKSVDAGEKSVIGLEKEICEVSKENAKYNKWSSEVCLDKPEPDKVPLWVKMFGIPLEAWSHKGISKLASSIGKPLIIDEMTANMCQFRRGRIGFASVLIEVDAKKPFKDRIDVQYRDKSGNIIRNKHIRIEPKQTYILEKEKKNSRKANENKEPQIIKNMKTNNGSNRKLCSNKYAVLEDHNDERSGRNINVEQKNKKMKKLKKPMKRLNWKNGNLFTKVLLLKEKLKETQAKIDKDPFNSKIREEVTIILKDYKEAMDDEYKNFLGVERLVQPVDEDDLMFIKKLDVVEASNMIKDITDKEIKEAMFDIDNDKAPGPNGYTSCFFKKAWNVVGMGICLAMKEFFQTGKLLKEMNATIILLIPKLDTPNKVSDFRPIACCNVLYKCISKVLTNRIKSGLEKVVNINQSAFIPGRNIQDNILLTQELLKGYNRKNGLKSTFAFSISVNGQSHGYCKGARGLRQIDPISPYLFTLVMEVLNLIIIKNIKAAGRFKYHAGCKDLHMTHLCFADDLMVFCNGDVHSITVVKKSLNEFSMVSGLFPNQKKITIFSGNINGQVKQEILKIIDFSIGKLPMRYLGVPLLEKCLSVNDCRQLIDKDHYGPLSNLITKRDIYDARFKCNNSVAELIKEDRWKWPSEWLDMFPILKKIQFPSLNDSSDKVTWISKTGKQKIFSVKEAWKSVRTDYSMNVWSNIKAMINLDQVNNEWEYIFEHLQSSNKHNNIISILKKIGVAACVYMIWNERNSRTFSKGSKEEETLTKIVKDKIRWKLASLNVKRTAVV